METIQDKVSQSSGVRCKSRTTKKAKIIICFFGFFVCLLFPWKIVHGGLHTSVIPTIITINRQKTVCTEKKSPFALLWWSSLLSDCWSVDHSTLLLLSKTELEFSLPACKVCFDHFVCIISSLCPLLPFSWRPLANNTRHRSSAVRTCWKCLSFLSLSFSLKVFCIFRFLPLLLLKPHKATAYKPVPLFLNMTFFLTTFAALLPTKSALLGKRVSVLSKLFLSL